MQATSASNKSCCFRHLHNTYECLQQHYPHIDNYTLHTEAQRLVRIDMAEGKVPGLEGQKIIIH